MTQTTTTPNELDVITMNKHTDRLGRTTISFEASELGMPPGEWVDPIAVEGVDAHLAEVVYNDDGDELLFCVYITERNVEVHVYND